MLVSEYNPGGAVRSLQMSERKITEGRRGERKRSTSDEKSQGFGENQCYITVWTPFSSLFYFSAVPSPLPKEHMGSNAALVG